MCFGLILVPDISGDGREQLASCQAAQVRIIDRHTSDNDRHLIGGFRRLALAVLHQALHNHLDYFLDVLESFLLGMAPRGAALPHQRRTVRVPALAIGFHHDPETVGLHLPRLLSVCHIPVQETVLRIHYNGTTVPGKTFYLETFGCQMNAHDSEKVVGTLLSQGYAQVATPEDAGLVLYNTCSIRDKAEQKVFSRLQNFKREGMKDKVFGV